MRPAAAALALLLALPPGGAQALSLKGLKNDLVGFLLEKVSVPGQFEIKAERIVNAEAGGTELQGVRVLDRAGTWFEAERLAFAWSPSRLLRGEVQIDRLEVIGSRIHRLPVAGGEPPAPTEEASGLPSEWPRSPIAVQLKALTIRAMQLSPEVIAGGMTFDGDGSLRDEGSEQSVQLALRRVDEVQGTVDLAYAKRFDTRRLTLNLRAHEAAGGAVGKLAGLPAGVPVALEVKGDGLPEQWTGALELNARDMVRANGSLSAQWARRIAAELSLTVVPGPRLDQGVRTALGEQAALDLSLAEDESAKVRIERAHLRADALEVRADGWYSRPDQGLELEAAVTIDAQAAPRLSRLTAPLRVEGGKLEARVSGSLGRFQVRGRGALRGASAAGFHAREVELSAQVEQSDVGTSVAMALIGNGLQGPSEAYGPVLGERVAAELKAERTARRPDALTLESLRLESASLRASTSGRIALGEGTTELEYQAAVPGLDAFSRLAGTALAGSARARGRLTGTAQKLLARGEMAIANARLNQESLGQVDLTHTVSLGTETQGRIELRMDSPSFGPGRAKAAFRASPERLALSDLDVDLLGIAARGSLSLPRSGRSPSGKLGLEIRTLAPLGRLAGTPMTGSGEGELLLEAAQGGRATGRLGLTAVSAGTIRLDGASLNAVLGELSGTPVLTGVLKLDGAHAGELALEGLELGLEGPLNGHRIRVQARGALRDHPLELDAAAFADLLSEPRAVRIDEMTAVLAGERLALAQAAGLTLGAAGWQLEDLDLALPADGRITGSAGRLDRTLRADLAWAQVPLRLARLVTDVPFVSGRVDGHLRGASRGAEAGLDAQGRVSGLRLAGAPDSVSALSVELGAAWDGATLVADGQLSGDFGEPVRARLTLPLTPGEGPLPEVPAAAPLVGELGWNGELERMFELLPLPDHLLSGRTAIDLRARGTVREPALSGAITLADGRYENLLTGTVLESLRLESSLRGTDALDFGLTGTDGVRGSLEVRGALREIGPGGPRIEVSASLSQLLAVRIDPAVAEVSGSVQLTGQPRSMDLKGTLEILRAEIRLLNPLPATVVDLGEVRIKGEPVEATRPEDENGAVEVRLDVAVALSDEIFVRGRGLDSEWGGALQISGTADSPRVRGRIEKRRGQLDLVGRVFDLSVGEIVFDGGREIDPTLEIRLEREANDITGRIRVSGPASDPSLTFSSIPSVPQDEVLPRVLFGRPSGALSGPEAIQLAAGVAALTTGKTSAVDSLRNALGVDVLRLEAGDGEDAGSSVNVGRYLREGVYVGAKQSLDGTSGSVVVEVEVTDHIVLDADVDQSADTSVGVTWRKKF